MLVLNSKMVISVRLSIFYIFILPFVLCHIENHYPERRLSLGALYPASAADLEYRLPTDLKPTLYDLTLQPDLNNGTFTGTVVITFDVLKTTSTIVLNVNTDYIPLPGINASLINSSSTYSIDTYSEDKVHEMVFFNLSNSLTVGDTWVISISYSGILANDMLGFYLSTYKTSETTQLMAITQFESTYARRAFPCFDEPAYRAQFSVKILRPMNMTSLANMPLQSKPELDLATGLILDTYETSPPMPTYLVAFGVSDLAVKFTNETFRVFARPAAISDASYVDSVGPLLLDSIGNFTGIKYPLQKMDVVAVPDFDAGAMENWGLTTFREKYVLYNRNLNTWREKFLVMSVVAHEFAHQWFGDLVTPELWDYAWLNEAFATYFEYTSNRWSPEWGADDTMYIIEAVQYALGQDIGSPRPMTSPVYTPAQINNIFDYVIYEKGGSILRMTENFLTSAVWQKGLNTYLTNSNYSTGTPEKLFSALQEAATSTGPTNLNETLQGWTTQPGYPLITVTLLSSNSTSSVYNITQKAYALDASYSGLTWNVPLTYTTQSEAQFDATLANRFWLLPSSPSTVNVNVNNSDWVIFNVNQVGFYRVNYDTDNWSKLKAQLDSNFNAIGAINRAQILDDAYQLARTGQLDYNTTFGLTAYLRNETELAPWNAFFTNMRYLLNQFYGTTTGDGLKQYAQQIMTNPFAELTSNLTVPLSTFLGSTTLLSAGLFSCDIELPECETLANSIFTNWRQNISVNLITPELKRTVFCTGLRLDTSVAAFTDVWNYYLASNNGAEKLTVMNALGCTSGADAINMYLDAVCNKSANNVRFQDRWIAFRALASRQSGVSLTLTYIAKNFKKFIDAVGPRYDSVIRAIANTISQPAHITQVQTLVNDSSVDQTLRNQLSSIVLPAVAKRQAWASSSQGASLKAWVDANTVKSSASSAIVNILLILMTVVSFIVHS